LHPTPVVFSSPVTSRGRNYPTIAFETDLPNLEAAQDNPLLCDPSTGANCGNPPNGAAFYPLFTTGIHDGICQWQQGGNLIPGTINHFGGSSTTEYGGLLSVAFLVPNFTTVSGFEDFNSGDRPNPCPVGLFPAHTLI
jgi:hypothetical protein